MTHCFLLKILRFFLLLTFFIQKIDAQILTPQSLIEAARSQIGKTLTYDASYAKLSYPSGDIPIEKGVCTDVIIRAFRAFGIDLQKDVSQSIAMHPKTYKKHLTKGRADTNIDHRRVKILVLYFKLQGFEQKTTVYKPGDILVFGSGISHLSVSIPPLIKNAFSSFITFPAVFKRKTF